MSRAPSPSVLCVDDDHDIAEIVEAILVDEGYAVSCLYNLDDDALMRAVGRLEPDCILLDSGGPREYGGSWEAAAALGRRVRPIPMVMFTAHTTDIGEAVEGTSERATAAHFAAIVPKPFDLDELIAAVASAIGHSTPFERGKQADIRRTKALVAALGQRGATEIKTSSMREWATFRDKDQMLCQLYWWQQRGVYQLGMYGDDGRMEMVGQFVNRDAAIEVALPG